MKKRITYKSVRAIVLGLYENNLSNEEKTLIYNKYLQLIRKLAYSGNVEAQCDLAAHYDDIGFWGVPNPFYNIPKKFYWYTKAANNGHASACNNLANMYEKGEGCKKDINKALELYKKAADLGDNCGQKNYKLLLKQIKESKV